MFELCNCNFNCVWKNIYAVLCNIVSNVEIFKVLLLCSLYFVLLFNVAFPLLVLCHKLLCNSGNRLDFVDLEIIIFVKCNTVKCRYNSVQFITILHTVAAEHDSKLKHRVTVAAEHDSNLKHTTDIPYLALTGELWGVSCEYIGEKWPRYNGTALYYFDWTYIEFNEALLFPCAIWRKWKHRRSVSLNIIARFQFQLSLSFLKDTEYKNKIPRCQR